MANRHLLPEPRGQLILLSPKYFYRINVALSHDFEFPRQGNGTIFEDGQWELFAASPQRLRQLEADKISYAWDAIIERTAFHASEGTVYYATHAGLSNAEIILRYLAKERRFHRRALAKALFEVISSCGKNQRRTRYIAPQGDNCPYYVLLALDHQEGWPYDDYRAVRRGLLNACCDAFKLRFPEATNIIGIAMEPLNANGNSEDVVYLNASEWTEADYEKAKVDAVNLGLLQTSEAWQAFHEDEYPEE